MKLSIYLSIARAEMYEVTCLHLKGKKSAWLLLKAAAVIQFIPITAAYFLTVPHHLHVEKKKNVKGGAVCLQ